MRCINLLLTLTLLNFNTQHQQCFTLGLPSICFADDNNNNTTLLPCMDHLAVCQAAPMCAATNMWLVQPT